MSILDMVQQQLGSGTIQQIAQQIGADPQQTQRAIDAALPVMVGSLAQQAQQPGGAQQLNTTLDQHADTLSQVHSLLGSGGGDGGGGGGGMGGALGAMAGAFGSGGGLGGILGSLASGGAAGGMLGHVLGGRQAQAQDAVAQHSGLDQQQVGKLLMILAPIVLGMLARRKQQGGTGGDLTNVLQQDHQRVQQQAKQPNNPLGGILGQMFGR